MALNRRLEVCWCCGGSPSSCATSALAVRHSRPPSVGFRTESSLALPADASYLVDVTDRQTDRHRQTQTDSMVYRAADSTLCMYLSQLVCTKRCVDLW